MDQKKLDKLRDNTRQLCAARNVAILPYGNAHWLKGNGVDLVVADLSWISERDLAPYEYTER